MVENIRNEAGERFNLLLLSLCKRATFNNMKNVFLHLEHPKLALENA
jgi:hypothetical protein